LTAEGGGYRADSDPYADGGDALTHTTGAAPLNVGYLLRSWLVVQKLKEVRAHVLARSNSAPTVSLTAPARAAAYDAPATVALTASAHDDTAVSTVHFYANGSLLGSDATAPYEMTWSNVAAGQYSLTARAVDELGATTESTAVIIHVQTPASPPSIHIGDLDGSAATAGKQMWRATVTVAAHDAAETLSAGAVVSGQWTGAYTGSGSCTTGASGTCSIVTANINAKKGSVTFSVNSVNHPRLTYRAGPNHDIDGSSNGAVVSVTRP